MFSGRVRNNVVEAHIVWMFSWRQNGILTVTQDLILDKATAVIIKAWRGCTQGAMGPTTKPFQSNFRGLFKLSWTLRKKKLTLNIHRSNFLKTHLVSRDHFPWLENLPFREIHPSLLEDWNCIYSLNDDVVASVHGALDTWISLWSSEANNSNSTVSDVSGLTGRVPHCTPPVNPVDIVPLFSFQVCNTWTS